MPAPKFELGKIVATRGAMAALRAADQAAGPFLRRHMTGDWGTVPPADARENEFSVEHGFRILSAYLTDLGEKLWIITEADRSVTTLLLPNEY